MNKINFLPLVALCLVLILASSVKINIRVVTQAQMHGLPDRSVRPRVYIRIRLHVVLFGDSLYKLQSFTISNF